MDVDAVLARKPKLALVDELAHTNAPGSRHPKRYQDILELLDAGIDVYTTLNVQHVESRAHTVEEITGSTMHETVPDSVLDLAEIELIDISPEDLMRRLDEGKVYLPDRAAVAMVNFFREGNLTALREMALAPGGRTRRPGRARLHAGHADPGAVENGPSPAGRGQRQPAFGADGALDAAAGRQPGRALAGGACGILQGHCRRRTRRG